MIMVMGLTQQNMKIAQKLGNIKWRSGTFYMIYHKENDYYE